MSLFFISLIIFSSISVMDMGCLFAKNKQEEQEKIDEIIVQIPEAHRQNASCLNLEQLLIFQMILGSFRSDAPEKRRFFVHGAGGTGKTHTYMALKKACEEEKISIMMCASTGVAATIFGGKTVHSAFGIKMFLSSEEEDEIAANDLVKECRVIIIDEMSMLDVRVLQKVDELCRSVSSCPETLFGDKIVILGGDFHQMVPVSGEKNSVYASSEFMDDFYHFELKKQMRQIEDPAFAEWLNLVASGEIRWIILYDKHAVDSMEKLVKFVYGEEMDGNGLIVSPTNKRSDEVNDQSLDIFGGQAEEFIGFDKVEKEKKGEEVAEEQTLPPKLIKLKPGSLAFCMQNVDPATGLANGTRLRYLGCGEKKNTLKFESAKHKGKIWELKRSSFKKKGGRRTQYPIRQGWASTIHKAQGQTCSKLGLFYPQGSSLFAAGMAYTLFSRLKSFDDFRYFAPNHREGPIMLRNNITSFSKAKIVDGKWIL